ncbi:hypothetical protein IAT40_004303 [Kwoniella sp. CBS 6097]
MRSAKLKATTQTPRKPVRASERQRLAKLKRKSMMFCIPFDKLPADIAEHIISDISTAVKPADLSSLMLVDKSMCHTFSPRLYQTLTVNEKMAKGIFEGINHTRLSDP